MSKFQTAFSLDLQRSITAQQADHAFKSGKVKSRNAFQCESPGCNVPMVCVNLETPRHQRRREPHFATSGTLDSHSKGCPYWLAAQPMRSEEVSKRNHDGEKTSATRLHVSAPFNRNATQTAAQSNSSTAQKSVNNTRGPRDAGSRSETNTAVHTVRRLVDEFKAQRFDRIVSLGNKEISIRDLFFDLSQAGAEIPRSEHVYWGPAYLNELKDGALQFSFEQEAKYDAVTSRPRHNIWSGVAKFRDENPQVARLVTRMLEGTRRRVMLYALGKIVARDKKSKYEALHINLYHRSLAYLHIEL